LVPGEIGEKIIYLTPATACTQQKREEGLEKAEYEAGLSRANEAQWNGSK
jgi:hypothetical protein